MTFTHPVLVVGVVLLLGRNPMAIILIFNADINKSIQDNDNENVPSYRSSPHHGVPLEKEEPS